ncbi:hypothetical protein BGW38_003692 [Lunasporangiospora selenospora]|uniref:Uncharacterized protein n=1 Tax=Lunasporangiospora selenospora TaxID=979761 RepID=A0A9P6FQ95_9FUNG|nr:hypothetical protein BGW38_003692 [Lunasporangiospora selenospora]
MDGVDCDWCLVCEKRTNEGEAYCSEECRCTDLMSSSAGSAASTSSSAYFSSLSDQSCSSSPSPSPMNHELYSMPPFVRKQRTSIPNIYAQCTSNPNPPASLLFTTPSGPNANASALSQHLLQLKLQQQHQQQLQQQQQQQQQPFGEKPSSPTTQYPQFYANLNALRPASPAQH